MAITDYIVLSDTHGLYRAVGLFEIRCIMPCYIIIIIVLKYFHILQKVPKHES